MHTPSNNENQLPQDASQFRTNATQALQRSSSQSRLHAGNFGESNLRGVKPGDEDEQDVDGPHMGAGNATTLGPRPVSTTPLATFDQRNTADTSMPPPSRTSQWVNKHGTPQAQAKDTGDDDTTYYGTSAPTPARVYATNYARTPPETLPLNSQDGPLSRQPPPSSGMFAVGRPSINDDTPISGTGEDSGMDDQLHSPNYPPNDSPTAARTARTSQTAIPLVSAAPSTANHALPPFGMMTLPPGRTVHDAHTHRRAPSLHRDRPYPNTPAQRIASGGRRQARTGPAPRLTQPRIDIDSSGRALGYTQPGSGGRIGYWNRAANNAALGIGRPPRAIQGRPRAVTITDIIEMYESSGQRVPSVLEPAPYVPGQVDFVTYRSGPTSPVNTYTPARRVASTPHTSYPGSSGAPQVAAFGIPQVQNPTATPAGPIAIDSNGHQWSGVSLPRFRATQLAQLGQRNISGEVSPMVRQLQQAAIGTPIGQARQPRIAVPTPGNQITSLHGYAVAAIRAIFSGPETHINFADPEHARQDSIRGC